MNVDFLPLFVSAISCIVAIKLITPFAVNIDLVDKPNQRKKHIGNIPLVGGISIFIAIIIGLLTTQIDISQQKNLLLAMMIVVVVGVIDDHKDLSTKSRILSHVIAVSVVVVLDSVVLNSLGWIFGENEFKLHSWAMFFTVFAVIGVMNAINMSDGIDGLSGALSLVVLLFIAYFSYIGGHVDYLTISLLICCALIPFLLFNLGVFGKSRRVFMGDAGTTLLGLVIAILLIALSQGDNATFRPVTALWLLAIPLIDTMAIMLRRVIKKKSPFRADREHLHHFFIRSGIGDRKALLIIVLLSLTMAFSGAWMEVNNVAEWKMFALFLLICLFYLFALIHAWKVMKYNAPTN
jgi:UDP-GlcNAc:undecaprenyl-phosphate/decaprenyl-phosphate GlcNAc-1-phosphate transferase